MQEVIEISTSRREELCDITEKVKEIVDKADKQEGLINVYVQGATAGIMIQENWDESVQQDVLDFLKENIPQGVWKHDRQDGNGDAHIKSGLVGPQETIPLQAGKLALSTWQNIFMCEFDGPRRTREIVVTVL